VKVTTSNPLATPIPPDPEAPVHATSTLASTSAEARGLIAARTVISGRL